MKKISWGFIGCGDVTERKSGPAFQKIENSEIKAVMSRTQDKVMDYAKRHQIARWYTNPTELINDPEVNAIYIATPPSSHVALTKQALTSGKPVYVEKPMGISLEECMTMNQAAKNAGQSLFVAYYRRCLPAFLKVKEIIDSGLLGTIRLVNLRLYQPLKPKDCDSQLPWRLQPEISGGGYFFDLACHQLDLLDFLLGPIVSASGEKANQAGMYEAEDIVTTQFRFQSGILGTGIWSFSVHEEADTDFIEIVGSKGKVEFATFKNQPVHLTTDHEQTFNFENPFHIQQPLIQTVVDELLGKGKCPSTGISAMRTNWVLDQILQ